MYISKIILNGFKSFANKTNIDLQDSMFISIVGPNGSGKSNILDAVKWIMGESSTKQLRSSSSSDVLFAGTKDVSAKNVCEVEIVFDNTQKKHSLPHQQISIKRKYMRSGENYYFINNNKVRQKDIVNFFLELGISKSSLLMVNQGKIDSFINMSGIERAKLIEQVAQVAIFEERKKESISKLNRSNENLTRLNDILIEKEQTQKILEKSASKAISYRNIKQELDQHVFLKAKHDYKNQNEEFETTNQKLKQLIQSKYEINELISANDLSYQQLKSLHVQLNKNQETLSSKVIDLNDNKQKLIYKLKEKSLVAQSNLNQVQFELEQTLKSKELCFENLNKAKENLNEFRSNLEIAQNNKNKIESTLYNLNSENVEYKKTYDVLSSKVQRLSFELKNLEEDLNYRDLKKIDTHVEFKTLKDCFEIQNKYEALIYDLLGNNLKNLVTKTSSDAKTLLNNISQNKLTKISIYPLDNLKAKYVNANINIVKSEQGFISLASDVVQTISSHYDILKDYLLTNIIIVDNIDNANKINQKFKNMFTIVTLDLKYIYPSGIFSGGFNKFSLANKIIRIGKLKNEITTITKELKVTQNNFKLNQEKITKLNESSQLNFELIVKFKTKSENTSQIVNQQQQRFKELSTKEIDLNTQIKQLTNSVSTTSEEKEIEDVEQQILTTKVELEQVKKSIFENEEKIEVIRLDKDKLSAKINDINLSIPNLENKIFNIEQVKQHNEQILSNFKNTYQPNINEFDSKLIIELSNKLKRIGSVDFEVIEQYELICDEIETYRNNIEDIEVSINKIKEAIANLEEKSNTRFNKFFNEINDNFKQYFKYIFPNGHAMLELSIDDNVRNINVIASTKGSAHNVISLLSGGEKALTIIALLFAILKVSDFSFVILDEIEAALDENNVDKIAKILTDFAKSTQIITITHRRGTMKRSDVLYGISHGVVGISQAVKIKLGEEDEFSKEII